MDYDWGSDTFIRELTGNPDSKGVQAEMWMGSHSRGPSMALCDNVSVP
jgi:mannose-6-phosphate isomerase class I